VVAKLLASFFAVIPALRQAQNKLTCGQAGIQSLNNSLHRKDKHQRHIY
jgi:hypothetical protein